MLSRLRDFADQNGWYLTVENLSSRIWLGVYSFLLARTFAVRRLEIEPFAYIRGVKHVRLGDNFRARRGLWLEAISQHEKICYTPTIVIGSNVTLSQYVHIAATHMVQIGSNVLIGSRVLISDHSHGNYSGPHSSPHLPPAVRPLTDDRSVTICDNVWLGDGVVVLPGVTIGYGSIVGANSVVARDIPPMTIAAGAPATPVKHFREDEGVWLHLPKGNDVGANKMLRTWMK